MHPNPTHLPIPPYLRSTLEISLTKEKKRIKKSLTVEAVMCHGVSHSILFCPNLSLVNAHCSEALVWFKVSEFCNTINPGPSLRCLVDILLFPGVLEPLML